MIDDLRGTGVALVTPLNADDTIDFTGFSKLVNHVVNGGVDYLVLMGTTGESPTVNWDEKMELLEAIAQKPTHNKPIVFGLGGNDTHSLVKKVKKLCNRPIRAVLSSSPEYNKPSQEGIFRHYMMLADASEYPVIIYNVPHRTSSNITADTILRLSEHDNIIGVKEASGDLLQCGIIARDKPENFLLLSGDDALTLPILALGGEGVISVIANAFPYEFSSMVSAALKGDFNSAAKQHLTLLDAYKLSVAEGNPSSVKAALEAQQICSRHTRLPLTDASQELVATFKKLLLKA